MHTYVTYFCIFKHVLVFVVIIATTASAKAEVVVSVLGDSLVAGFGLEARHAFPVQLEASLRALGEDVRVINAGVSGDTSAGGESRVDWVLQDSPDIVILVLGANDMLRGIDPVVTKKNLMSVIQKLQTNNIVVLLVGMKAARNLGKSYVEKFDKIYPDLARSYQLVFYPFFLENVALEPTLNQEDLIHPNAMGVRMIVKRIIPSVFQALDRHKTKLIPIQK